MCSEFALFAIFSTFLIAFLWWFLKYADADLTVLYLEKFGNSPNELLGQVVWITGASSGIGEFLAYKLASCGVKLVLSGTNEKRLQIVKTKCLGYGIFSEDVITVPFNITDYDAHDKCVETVLEHFGKIDILVNNAGMSQRANFSDIDLQVDKHLFDINVFGTLNLTRKVLKHFLNRGCGHFVVTSSCTGKMGVPSSASYTGSKHALHGYFECLRTETTRKGIDVTIICPGPVFSGFLERAATHVPGEAYGGKQNPKDRRMATGRCAQLMAVAIANKVDETWISIQPSLMLFYVAQYAPTFFRNVLVKKLYTPDRAAAVREGRW